MSPNHRQLALSRRAVLAALVATAATPGLGVVAARAQGADKAAALLAQMPGATSIVQGSGRRRLYVFFDPNCPYCHHLYLALRGRLAGADLQVHWVVLGMLTSSSEPKAAAMLQAPDRLRAFETNENDYDFAANGQPGGGIEPAATIQPETRRLLQRNLQIYRSQKLFGVPVLVWKRRGGAADMYVGVPSQQQLTRLLGDIA
jgi:thiol:disulfide interchange protein DsbG